MKAQKLQQIIALRSQITSESSLESLNTVVSTPEHLPLSNLEKSVLSKGLEFVATCVSKKLDEFSVKQEVEKFYRRAVNWKSFQDKNTSDKDTFETLQTQKSKWTPPEESSSSICRVLPPPARLRENCDGKLQMISLTAVLLSRYVCSYNKNKVCLIIKFKQKSGLTLHNFFNFFF